MLRVERRQTYHELSEFERERIIGLQEAGIEFREIARLVPILFVVREVGERNVGTLKDLE